ncbi:cellulose synthase subunit BcsC [Anaerohalosphaera lusitana]|uniref:Cellulose synthase subunit BcsC n=1 Tax=Anaerohalosphaera lusitana TaxID=1936003 RepID=A0A1U9NG56_9BACT|nr:tetratricopeptide repeat protein [Anaerohalosphaera lusitana]AQT66912.1 cellulose synthase subunit BcsC [Anaerohalosphaera lusitana]
MKENNKLNFPASLRLTDQSAEEGFTALTELGDCYLSVGDHQQAQLCYDQAADIDPDRAEPYVGIGAVAFQNGNTDEAENAFKVALRLDRTNAKAHCGLAMIYHNAGAYTEAFDRYLKCLEQDTDNLSALLGLFQTSCQMGSFEKVTHYLEVYLSMHPDDHSVMFCVATLYMRDGKLQKAQRALNAVLKADSDNTDAAALLEEVEHQLAQKA